MAGETQLGIARNLQHDGVKTRRGGKWHQGGVRYILLNPLYIGLVRDGDELVEGEHKALIDRETWDKAQALLTAQAKVHTRGRTAGLHLFRKGFLRCGGCGESMVPRTSNDAYNCYGHLRDPVSCSQSSIPRAEIDGAVVAYFQRVGFDLDATRAEMAEKIDRRLAESRALSAAAGAEVATLAANMERVRGDYKAGKISAKDWSDLRTEFEDELDGAQRKAAQLAGQLEAVESEDQVGDVEVAVVERLARIREAIAGRVNSAASIDAVRAELLTLFDGFILHRNSAPAKVADVELVGKGGDWIEPLVKAQEGLLPVLTPAQAALQAENKTGSVVSVR